jgi:carboxyl-terminal processing protease
MFTKRVLKNAGVGGLLVWSFVLGLAPPAPAQPAPATKAAATLTADQLRRNLESFEYVWKTIRDKHWDPKLGGLDWQAIHDEYRPQVAKADSMAQCREALTQMIRRLGQSHFQIVPRAVYNEMDKDTGRSAGEDVPGFDVRVLDGQVLMTHVDEGLPAAKLGIRPGWQILKIDGQDLAPALAKVRATYKTSTTLDLYLHRTVMARLLGRSGEKVAVLFRDGQDREVSLKVPLTKPQGVAAQLGNFPTIYVQFVSRRVEPAIAYFGLTAFFDPVRVMKAFGEAVTANRQADGFIIDLRGNPGGLGLMAVGLGNWFVKQPDQKLGTMFTRDGALKFVLNPQPETFTGPLAVLVDGCSASTSEVLAGGLQGLKRAQVFGTTTAGATLLSTFDSLPNGDGFQYAFADYVSAGGQRLEGAGVKPDTIVAQTRPALLAGHDPVLEAAVAWIHSQKKATK